MFRQAVVVVCMAAFIGGCSSGTSGKQTPSKASSLGGRTTMTSPATTTVASNTVSPAQFASIVASDKSRIDAAASSIADCGYTYDPSSLQCSVGRLTYATTVATLNVDLIEGALDPTSPEYVGEPPAELVPLIDKTRAAFATLAAAETALEKKCGATETDACDRAVFDWVGAKNDVTAALAGWKPYGA
jgi:hypothetical protein